MSKIPEPPEALHDFVLYNCWPNKERVRDMLARNEWPCPMCAGVGSDIEESIEESGDTCAMCKGTKVWDRACWEYFWERAVSALDEKATPLGWARRAPILSAP